MKVFYDTEFLEQGCGFPIHPISIGMVREDGAEYYAVNRNAPWAAIAQHEWLRANVLPHLPGRLEEDRFRVDTAHPDVKSLLVICHDVERFLFEAACAANEAVDAGQEDPLELWAWYSSYDHVVLAQLFGRMADMPPWMPYFTHDLKVAQNLLAPNCRFPEQSSTEHHALNDARWVRDSSEALREHVARLA